LEKALELKEKARIRFSTYKMRKKLLTPKTRKNLTDYEERILEVINENGLPYKYVGNGDFWLTSEGKHINPDFVNVDGEKIVIEVFCNYWKKKSHGSVEEYIIERRRLFANFGWKVIFIGDKDLNKINWKKHCLQLIK